MLIVAFGTLAVLVGVELHADRPARLPGLIGVLAAVAVLAVVAIWGSNFVVIKYALHTLPPMTLAALRRFVSAAFTTHAVKRLRPTIERVADGLLDDTAAAGTNALKIIPVARINSAHRRISRSMKAW